MKQPTFRRQWLVVWMLVLAVVGWVEVGQAWTRRRFLRPAPVTEEKRVAGSFLALLFPSITPGARKYAMSRAELTDLLERLKQKGYVSIGLEDVREFYAGRRLLPPKAVLLAFTADDSRGVMLADRSLNALRMRAVAFLTRTAGDGGAEHRRFLTDHAVAQMRAGGTWEFGRLAPDASPGAPALGPMSAVLDNGARPRADSSSSPGLRFIVSELGLNDAGDNPRDLHIMAVRADHFQELNERIIENSWTRHAEVSDDFTSRELDPDWIAGWGVVSKGGGRLALLPLPRQTGAGIFLRGTEKWRDLVLEFDLKRHQKEFWAYARYRGEAGYVRVGIRDGWWCVEQKIGPMNLPTLLARASVVDDRRPARVRLVLKDEVAIVHVNGRMLFGRALRVHPRVASGRVLFGVYDAKPRTALAVLSRVRVGPVKETWVAFKDEGGRGGFDEERLYALRDEAVYARALSPRWMTVSPDGSVVISREQETLIRSLAGFFGCRLVPMAEFPAGSAAVLSDPAAVARLLAGLEAAAREFDGPGVNVRVRVAELGRPETIRFFSKLHSRFRLTRRQVWITADGPVGPGGIAALPVDGLLRPTADPRSGYERLDAVPTAPAIAAHKEFAFLP